MGFLGRLGADKGVHVLARAMSQLIDQGVATELVVAGEARFVDTGSARIVEQALVALGSRVTRLGWSTAGELMDRIDVLAVPSIGRESFGLVVTEAMSAGVPVVVTDAGALPEIVGPDHPWVARAGDVESLAAALRTALVADPATRAEVAGRARDRWERLYSPAAGRARFVDLLAGLATR